MSTKKLTLLALLTASSLILFVVEAQIPLPIPVPGVKLGLSNVVTLVALYLFDRKSAGVILVLRIVLGNFVVGNLMLLLYSLAGGLLCLLVMGALQPLMGERQIFLLSIFGAIAHNAGQLLVAILVTETPALLAYAPILLVSAMVTGFFTGHCAQALLRRVKDSAWNA